MEIKIGLEIKNLDELKELLQELNNNIKKLEEFELDAEVTLK